MKRSPLKRSSSPMKRKRLPSARSARSEAYKRELDAITPELAARAGNRCEYCKTHPWTERHHRCRRSQRGDNSRENLVLLCGSCHRDVHAHPAWGFRTGLLLHHDEDPATRPIVRVGR